MAENELELIRLGWDQTMKSAFVFQRPIASVQLFQPLHLLLLRKIGVDDPVGAQECGFGSLFEGRILGEYDKYGLFFGEFPPQELQGRLPMPWEIDGVEQEGTLLDLVSDTLKAHPDGSVIAYKDNSIHFYKFSIFP